MPQPGICHLLAFQVAGISCAIRLENVGEVLPLAMLSRPPGMPRMLEGFLNLGGTAVPVLRLDRLFGFKEQSLERYTPLIVLHGARCPLALLVERVDAVLSLPVSALAPLDDKDSFKSCAEGVIHTNGGALQLLSTERMFLKKEQECVAEFQAREQQRLAEVEAAHP